MIESLRSHGLMGQPKQWTIALLMGLFSCSAVLAGVVPDVSRLTDPYRFNSVANAQAQPGFTDQDIRNYARAVLDIEGIRETAYRDIESILDPGQAVPDVSCNETRSINQLKKAVREIAVEYCNEAKSLIESSGLTVSRFNEITKSQQADPKLQQRIQAELLRQKPQ